MLDERWDIPDKEAVINFLLKNEEVSCQIDIANEQTKQLFPDRRVKLEVRDDPENGDETLYFLIQREYRFGEFEEHISFLEKEHERMNMLYDKVELSDQFIVTFDFDEA